MADMCTDNRFELIEKYKQMLIESTNISDSSDEMAVLDDILFRFWQMGWLDKLEQPDNNADVHKMVGDTISRKAVIDALDNLDYMPGEWTIKGLTMCKDVINGLPSAHPEKIAINLNETIKVKLTDLGKNYYYHRFDELNKKYGREICKPSMPKTDEDGYSEFQLWEFIQQYGKYIDICLPNVIEPLEIVLRNCHPHSQRLSGARTACIILTDSFADRQIITQVIAITVRACLWQKGGKMANYHVGCGLAGIYAGTLKKSGDEWLNKSDVTNEAINAVVDYMYWKIPEGENSFAYGFKMRDGNYVRLMVESCDHCPEWAKEALGENEDGNS